MLAIPHTHTEALMMSYYKEIILMNLLDPSSRSLIVMAFVVFALFHII